MKTHKLLIGLTVGTIFTAIAISGAVFQRHLTTATLNVTGKERLMSVSSSDGNTSTEFKNFVYADDDTYRVKDSLFNGHFRAGTVYARIPDGPATCDVVLSGYRWGFLSVYLNIIEANCTVPK